MTFQLLLNCFVSLAISVNTCLFRSPLFFSIGKLSPPNLHQIQNHHPLYLSSLYFLNIIILPDDNTLCVSVILLDQFINMKIF